MMAGTDTGFNEAGATIAPETLYVIDSEFDNVFTLQ